LRGEYFSTQKTKGGSGMNLRLLALAVFALVQLGVPAYMIYQRESVLRHGRVFKFQTAPVDPVDAFRGRYVALSFQANTAPANEAFPAGTQLWAVLTEDENGFAKIERVSRSRVDGDNVMPVTAGWSSEGSIHVDFPFDRYYMEESAAPRAEAAYRENSRRTNQNAYVTVRVYHGSAAVEELYVGGKPIRDFLREEAAK
jgi:uncharacterized membrane-anchored protein